MPSRHLQQVPFWAAIVFLGMITLAILVPFLFTPYDPLTTDASAAFQSPTLAHPLGTDQVGRDVWARLVYGARSSVLVGLGATVVAVFIGTIIGTSAGMLPSAATYSLSRGVEVLMAMPEFLLALFLVAIIGPGPIGVFFALALASIPAYANISRSAALTVRSGESVRAARILGLSPGRIFVRYIAPESVQPVIALSALGAGVTILAAASLSFLGLGVQAPTPDWGLMLAESRAYLSRAWWLVVYPGLILSLTVGALAVLGRTLQRRLRS